MTTHDEQEIAESIEILHDKIRYLFVVLEREHTSLRSTAHGARNMKLCVQKISTR
jgi:hypothetical protein